VRARCGRGVELVKVPCENKEARTRLGRNKFGGSSGIEFEGHRKRVASHGFDEYAKKRSDNSIKGEY